jgi:hypothetical protein
MRGTPANDLSGQVFGRLTVLRRHGRNAAGNATWLCACVCGNSAVAIGSDLNRQRKKSCGCLIAELTWNRNRRGLRGRGTPRLMVDYREIDEVA